MKKIKPSVFLFLILIISLLSNLYFFYENVSQERIIKNKDKAITEFKKTVELITSTNNKITSIVDKLSENFELGDSVFNNTDSSYYYVVYPKDWNAINYTEIWDFSGLEIEFDKNNQVKRVDFYKP